MNYINDPKYFGTEIVFRGFGKHHFLFGETHVLPATILGCRIFIFILMILRPFVIRSGFHLCLMSLFRIKCKSNTLAL